MYGLVLLLVVISALQVFYSGFLQTLRDFYSQQVLSNLIQYFSGGFLGLHPIVPHQINSALPSNGYGFPYPYPYEYQGLLLTKAYTYSAIVFIVVISVALFRMRGRGPELIDTAYSLVVGGGITVFLSYFLYYQGAYNFGFVDAWLLQPLLFLPIALIFRTRMIVRWSRKGQKVETRTNDHERSIALNVSNGHDLGDRPQAVRKPALYPLLVLALLLAGSITLTANGRLFYGPFVSEPRLESTNLQSFSIEHLSSGHFLIGASIEVSSSLYAQLADYGADKVLTVIPAYMAGYSTLANNTIRTEAKLRHNFNYLILTKYELTNGLNGDVLADYINATEVINLKAALDSNQNLVYNSGQAYLYAFD
jgi:hypothetical protein